MIHGERCVPFGQAVCFPHPPQRLSENDHSIARKLETPESDPKSHYRIPQSDTCSRLSLGVNAGDQSVLRTIFLGGPLAWFALRIFFDVFLRANGGFVVTFILVMASNSLGFVWAGRDTVSSNSHWAHG